MPYAGEYDPWLDVEDFFSQIQQPNDLLLLDIRKETEYQAWHIEGRHTPQTLNIPYADFVADEQGFMQRIPRERKIVVVCAKGTASDAVAEALRQRDFTAVNLDEGMLAWGNYYARRTVAFTTDYQIYQVERPARGCLGYILISQGAAAIIDPARHIQPYLDFLSDNDLRLALILDTHAHADHISGGPALAEATGAAYYLHPYDGIHPFDMLPARLHYHMLADGMQFQVGDLRLESLHVPGHTLGLVNFLARGSDGQAFLFSGDSLFIQSFGRPDLGGQGRAWAPLVYASIFERLRTVVPGAAWVLPGHYARPDEAGPDGLFTRRFSDLWQENHDLQVSKDAFIDFVLTHLPVLPPQYIQIKRVNAGLARPSEDEASELELGKNVCALSTAY